MGLSRANLQTIAARTGHRVVAAWSDRDAGAMGTIVGVVMHHTGTAWGTAVAPTLQIVREGRSDLQNALCTFYIDRAGTIYLVTEKIAWHAGVGDYRGITDGNGHFLGIEAESDGVTWTPDTVDAYVALVAEICRFLGADPATWAIRHATWATPPGRKTDFAGLNEATFRARIAARLNGTPTPAPAPTPRDDDMRLIQQTDRGIALVGPGYFRQLAGSEVGAANALYGPAIVYSSPADFDTAKTVSITGVTEGFGQLIGEVHGKVVDSRFGLDGRPGPDADDLLGQVLSLRAEVRALASAPASAAGQTAGPATLTEQDKADIVAGVIAGLAKLHLAP